MKTEENLKKDIIYTKAEILFLIDSFLTEYKLDSNNHAKEYTLEILESVKNSIHKNTVKQDYKDTIILIEKNI